MPLAGPDRQSSVGGTRSGCSLLLAILLAASPCASAQTPSPSPQLTPPSNQLRAAPHDIPLTQSSDHYLKLIPLAQNYERYLKLVSSTLPADPGAPRTATSPAAPAPPLTAPTPVLVKSR